MKTICCYFVDFWSGFSLVQYLSILGDKYQIVINRENPDYLFYSCFGREHYKYTDCIKIFISEENAEPNFNDCDYAVSLSLNQYGDRALHSISRCLIAEKVRPLLSSKEMLNRKFCNFIYSNNYCADPFRIRFFEELSKYKKVDSVGPLLNNMGYCVPKGRGTKVDFQCQYKFTLAIENSSMPGYTTEKLYDPLLAHSLPIYWGNPQVRLHCNPKAFINLMDYGSIEEVVEEIIRLDQDDTAYLEKVTAPFWPDGDSLDEYIQMEKERFFYFFDHIFSQPLEQAHRRCLYGWTKKYMQEQRLLRFPSRPLWRRVCSKIRRIVKK